MERESVELPCKGVDGRSYKDVLLCNIGKIGVDVLKGGSNVALGPGLTRTSEAAGSDNSISIVIKDKDIEWLQNRLIAQILAMYDSDWVQQLLIFEGFKVKVSSWFGFYAVIRFEEEEHIDIFWELKDSVLKPWLSDIDTIEDFMSAKKLKVWVCIEGLPLVAWRNLRISTTEYDDKRCWIDAVKLNGRSDCPSDGLSSSPGRSSPGKDLRGDSKILESNNEPLLLHNERQQDRDSFPRDGVNASDYSLDNIFPNPHVDPTIPSFGTKNVTRHGKELNMPKLCEKSLEDRPAVKEELFEVQVAEASESITSAGHSVSIESVFDCLSGLFSIKPKLVTQLGSKNFTSIRSKSVSGKSWGPLCSQFVPKSASSLGKKYGSVF
ncbi:hypothetical protein V6N13_060272 [Hibiscus sabdariffa]